jgi:hypothetical protein
MFKHQEEAKMSKKLVTTRRAFVAAMAVTASSIAWIKSVFAQPTPQTPGEADFLFVQSAKGMMFDKATNKLTLTGVSPVMVFFADRPERIAGNMKTAAFIPFWSEGKDSFKSNPPNADVSIIEGKALKQIVVELQDPVLNGDNLSYTVKVLQGQNAEMPANGADVSVFIDIIGRPLTPFSFAGVARRSYRRAYWGY